MIRVDVEKCTGCGACLDVCPGEAITLVSGKAEIDSQSCQECGACAQACPVGAISEIWQPVPVEPAPAYPYGMQKALPVEAPWARRLATWAGIALAFAGREILPRVIDNLMASLERSPSQPSNVHIPVSQQTGLSARAGAGKAYRRRRRRGYR